MATRSVLVELRANVRGLVAGFKTASQASAKMQSDLAQHARKNEAAYDAVGKSLLGIGALAGAGMGVAIKTFADFDAQMSSVQAATHETESNMKLLREAAVQAGADTAFSATEAAQAIEEMAKAGVSTADILGGGLQGALDLAAAGSLDVASASEIAATAMTQFGLSGADIPHIADLLAAGAGKAQGSVEDLAAALNYVGVPAANFGISIEDTTGALALFASAGLVGQKAGTSFRGMLVSMANPAAKTRTLMDELNLSFFDAQGNFIGVAGVADELQTKLGGLTDEQRNAALAQIFGNESLAAAQTLYKGGATAVEDWTAKVNDAGYAAETAATRLDNLKGDIEALGGSIETALIGIGESGDAPLRGVVQRMTALVNVFNDAPPAVQTAVGAIGAVTAGVGLLGGSALIAIPKIVNLYDNLGRLGRGGALAQKGMRGFSGFLLGPWGVALGAATVALGVWANKQYESNQRVQGLADNLDEQTGAITDNTREWVVNRLEQDGLLADAQALGISTKTVTDAFLGQTDAIVAVNEALAVNRDASSDGTSQLYGYQTANVDTLHAVRNLEGALNGNNGELEAAKAKHKRVSEAMAEGKGATDELTDAQLDNKGATGAMAGGIDGVTDAADDATSAIDEFEDAITSLNEPYANARQASRNYEEAIDDFDDALKEARKDGIKHSQMLDINTAAGRKLQAALDRIADEARAESVALLRSGTSADVVRGKMNSARDRFIAAARAMGYGADEANGLANKLFRIPKNVTPRVSVQGTGSANAAIDSVSSRLIRLDGRSATVTVTTRNVSTGRITSRSTRLQADGGVLDFYGNGGLREHHTAQIAPAGSWRVWGEPETGGEAYIPLSPAKRERSRQILDDVAERFGGVVRYFANGGMNLASSGGSAAPVTVDAPNVRVFIGERELTDIVRVQVDGAEQRTARALHHGRRV